MFRTKMALEIINLLLDKQELEAQIQGGLLNLCSKSICGRVGLKPRCPSFQKVLFPLSYS
jgi:hypothetical protein